MVFIIISCIKHNSGIWGRRQWYPTPVLLPGKSHGQRSLVDCSPWGRQESDTTGQLHLHFSLSCIGEGNGNRLQCSCLENPTDGGAWWAAVYGVAQSQTELKRQQQLLLSKYLLGTKPPPPHFQSESQLSCSFSNIGQSDSNDNGL